MSQRRQGGGHKVDLDDERSGRGRDVRKSSRRINHSARSDDQKYVAVKRGTFGALHGPGRQWFFEPHHAGTQSGPAPWTAWIVAARRSARDRGLAPATFRGFLKATAGADVQPDVPVQFNDVSTSRAMMQTVHILGRQRETPEARLDVTQGQMRGVRFPERKLASPCVVESPHKRRVFREAPGRRHILDATSLPQPSGPTERCYSALGGYARTGEYGHASRFTKPIRGGPDVLGNLHDAPVRLTRNCLALQVFPMRWTISTPYTVACVILLNGCHEAMIQRQDRSIHALVDRKQLESLGERHDADIGRETGHVSLGRDPYLYGPHPVGAALPPPFDRAPAPRSDPQPAPPSDERPSPDAPIFDGDDVVESNPSLSEPAADSETSPQDSDRKETPTTSGESDRSEPPPPSRNETSAGPRFTPTDPVPLREVLRYAAAHARDLQTAKEDLYLAALDLTLERHLWTPQFSTRLQAEFADYGQVRDFDRAMTAVAEVAARQRLPLGGEVTAKLIATLMRDLGAHITSGETGQFIMEANIPLFRGAGSVAQESRYRAEREMIYATRIYERFRRQFAVEVASAYFQLQRNLAAIRNAEISRDAFYESYLRAKAFGRHQEMTIFEIARVESSLNSARSAVEDAIERYAAGKDQFKILIGMPVGQPFDVVPQDQDQDSAEIERLLPDIDESSAIDVALRFRLDLLNELDAIDDAKRGVHVARNAILPDLNLRGSMTMSTDPNRKNALSYNTERTTWRGFVTLSMDDRMTERHAYRKSLITLRRSERDHEQTAERVRAEVRSALRRIHQARANREIQIANVRENEKRYQGAWELNRLGRATNQDLVDAQNDLLNARDRLAAAEAQVRTAILELRLATDMLRIEDDGTWRMPPPPSPQQSRDEHQPSR